MTEHGLKPGDTVRLKSGGPMMTVDHIITPARDSAYCIWFDNDGKRHREIFSLASLKRADDDESSIGIA